MILSIDLGPFQHEPNCMCFSVEYEHGMIQLGVNVAPFGPPVFPAPFPASVGPVWGGTATINPVFVMLFCHLHQRTKPLVFCSYHRPVSGLRILPT